MQAMRMPFSFSSSQQHTSCLCSSPVDLLPEGLLLSGCSGALRLIRKAAYPQRDSTVRSRPCYVLRSAACCICRSSSSEMSAWRTYVRSSAGSSVTCTSTMSFWFWHSTGKGISRLKLLGSAALSKAASLKPCTQPCIRRYVAERIPAEGGRITHQHRSYGTTWWSLAAVRNVLSSSVSSNALHHLSPTLQSEQQGVATNVPDVWDFEGQDSQAHVQDIDLDTLVHPVHITDYIKQLKAAALSSSRGPDREASLARFIISMDDLLATAAPRMSYINFAAVVTASAQVWSAARRFDSFKNQADLHEGLEAVYQQCLHTLQPMLADLSAWEISNVVWASATLGCNPDAVMLGMLHDLTARFVQLTDAPQEDQRPSALGCASMLWALATMRYPAAAEVVDAISNRMYSLLLSTDQYTRPNAQNIANSFWALKELKHVPSHGLVSAMLDHLITLCYSPDSQPRSQSISNCLLACAELRLGMDATCVEELLSYLFEMHVSQVDYQHYCNAAWSLALMGSLDFTTFASFLNKLTTKQLSARQAGKGRAQPSTWEARQLYQALAWLKPSPGSDQMEAWSTLHSWLQAVASEPAAVPVNSPGQAELWHALDVLGMPFKAQVPCWMYWADAVLTAHDSSVDQAILVLESSQDFLTNIPSRLLGHVALRNTMLERYGTVVPIPYNPDSTSVESMADDIKAAVEAKTGLPLDSWR